MAKDRIIVGVDGSEPSKVALAWAIRHAHLTGQPLEVVATWEIPASFGFSAALPEDLDLEADAKEVVRLTLDEVLTGDDPRPTVRIVEGHAAPVLTELSKEADLLVVGRRGHGAFTGMLLGSVSTYCIAHAHCPVVVVHSEAS